MNICINQHLIKTNSLKCPNNTVIIVGKKLCCVITSGGQIYITPRSNICQENENLEGGALLNLGSYIGSFFFKLIPQYICLVSLIAYFSTFKAIIFNVLTYLCTQGRNRIREMSLTGLFVLHIGNPGSYPWLVAWQLSCCPAVSPVNRLKTARNDLLSDYKLEGAATNFFTSS